MHALFILISSSAPTTNRPDREMLILNDFYTPASTFRQAAVIMTVTVIYWELFLLLYLFLFYKYLRCMPWFCTCLCYYKLLYKHTFSLSRTEPQTYVYRRKKWSKTLYFERLCVFRLWLRKPEAAKLHGCLREGFLTAGGEVRPVTHGQTGEINWRNVTESQKGDGFKLKLKRSLRHKTLFCAAQRLCGFHVFPVVFQPSPVCI